MKKQSKQFLRRSCSLLLALVLCLLYLPTPVQAKNGTDETQTAQNEASKIFALEAQAPSELDQYPDDVYGKADGRPFQMSRQDELVLITRSASSSSAVGKAYYLMDNISMAITAQQDNGDYVLGGAHINTAESFSMKTDSWITNYDSLEDPQSIGVDRDGTGRKEYIATIGHKNNYIYLYVQNAKTGTMLTYQLGETWFADTLYGSIVKSKVDNYLAITAGDYDGDGKDSIVVFVSGKGDNQSLWEFVPSGSGWSGSRILDLGTVVKDHIYADTTYTFYDAFKPAVSLTTGDFNGDGRDQLAFSAGYYMVGIPESGFSLADGYEGTADNLERFATCVGIMDKNNGWKAPSLQWMYDVDSNYTYSNGEYIYPVQVMHAGMIAAGDVNNDGIDEIVAAGYTGFTKAASSSGYSRAIYNSNHKLTKVSHMGDFYDRYACSVIYYKSGSGYQRSALALVEMPMAMGYTWRNSCNDKDFTFPRLCVACGKTNGNNSPTDVFINGVIYRFDNDSFTPQAVYTPSVFGQYTYGSAGGENVNNLWVRNVAVGNFDGNNAGREQFVFTFWMGHLELKFSSRLGVIAGALYQDATDGNGNVTQYDEPDAYACSLTQGGVMTAYAADLSTELPMEYWNWLSCLSTASSDSSICAVPVAVDVDNDGVKARFNQSGYVYTDPEVHAVLEAGPIFAELEEAGGYEDSCSTSYSISTGFGTGTSRADNTSFEVGVAAEASVAFLKFSLEAGYAMDWSHAYETSYSVTQTTEFAAQSEDLVVISRVPELIYTYDIWDNDTSQWIENGMHVRVPLSPRYFMMGVDEYNEFVDEYNAIVGANSPYRLIKIQKGVDLPLNHEGNPDKYWRNWASAGEGGTRLSASDYQLSWNSGSASFAYSVEAEESESEEMSHGFHFGLTIQGGGDYLCGEAWAGGYLNLDYSHSTGHSTTKVNTTESGGHVPNIKANAVEGLTYEEVKSSYGFTWNFGRWTRTLMGTGNKVPFYGYTVSEVKRRPLPPALADWTESVDEGYAAFTFPNLTSALNSVLTVTKVSGDSHITYDSDSKSIQVAAGLTAGTYTAVFKISNGLACRDTTFSFTLEVTGKNGKWMKNANGWWYQRPDGTYPKNQWEKIDGKWYHFDEKGYMQTGWLKLSDKWYYLGTNGAMTTGWQKISDKWYYFAAGGAMQTGWLNLNGKYYYLAAVGAMTTGWLKINAVWYFFKSSGVMAAREWYNGYWFNASGSWTYTYKGSWKHNAKGWWFGDTSGWYAKSCSLIINDQSYTFDANGYWIQ